MGEFMRKPPESCRTTPVHVPDGHLGNIAAAGEPSVERRRKSMSSGTIFLPNMQALVGTPTILARLAIAPATMAAADAVPHGRNIPPRLTGNRRDERQSGVEERRFSAPGAYADLSIRQTCQNMIRDTTAAGSHPAVQQADLFVGGSLRGRHIPP
jgi:hypothetical protein